MAIILRKNWVLEKCNLQFDHNLEEVICKRRNKVMQARCASGGMFPLKMGLDFLKRGSKVVSLEPAKS